MRNENKYPTEHQAGQNGRKKVTGKSRVTMKML